MVDLMPREEWEQRFAEALVDLDDEAFEVTVSHDHRPGNNPRMSGIGSCARQHYWKLAGQAPTDPRTVPPWSSMLGNFGQALVTKVLEKMGYTVGRVEEEVTLLDGRFTGHLDSALTGLDIPEGVEIGQDTKYRSIWGLLGTKKSYGLVNDGLPYSDVEVYMQVQSYLKANPHWPAFMITAHPFDFSALKREAAIKKFYPAIGYRLIVEPDEEAQDLCIKRAKMHIAAQAMGEAGLPRQEYNPEKTDFPCGYCEWRSLCIAKRNEYGVVFPEIPMKYRTQMDLSEVAYAWVDQKASMTSVLVF